MGKFEYDISQLVPKAGAEWSGNPFDPVNVRVNKALGSFGAIPPYFVKPGTDIITKLENSYDVVTRMSNIGVVHSLMPLLMRRINGAQFYFPTEPLVTVSCKNVIVRRNVAKWNAKPGFNGTIKERWSQDDYEVTIQGVVNGDDETVYPKKLVMELKALFDERQAVEVEHQILLIFGIKFLAIESVSFPHTKGINNQNFEIKGYSDSNVNLLIEQ